MAGLQWAFLGLAVAFAGLLIFGLVTGEMPGRPISVVRAEHPVMFWVFGGIWALFACFAFAAAIAG